MGTDLRHGTATVKVRHLVFHNIVRQVVLFLRGVKDGAAVLRAFVVALPVWGRRVVRGEENFQYLPRRNHVGVKLD